MNKVKIIFPNDDPRWEFQGRRGRRSSRQESHVDRDRRMGGGETEDPLVGLLKSGFVDMYESLPNDQWHRATAFFTIGVDPTVDVSKCPDM